MIQIYDQNTNSQSQNLWLKSRTLCSESHFFVQKRQHRTLNSRYDMSVENLEFQVFLKIPGCVCEKNRSIPRHRAIPEAFEDLHWPPPSPLLAFCRQSPGQSRYQASSRKLRQVFRHLASEVFSHFQKKLENEGFRRLCRVYFIVWTATGDKKSGQCPGDGAWYLPAGPT